MRYRKTLIAAAVAGAAVLTSCRPELVVRLTTRVFADGGIQRRLEVIGRDPDGRTPTKPSWLEEEAHIQLADRKAWTRVDEGPGYLAAEGFFRTAGEVPGTLAHRTEAGTFADKVNVSLQGEDLVILKRWIYRETWSDPYGSGEAASALDRLLELGCRALREELGRQFGKGMNTAPAESIVRGEGRALILELLAARAKAPGRAGQAERNKMWAAILQRHAITVAAYPEDHFWEAQGPVLLEWSRRKVAEALSTPERPVQPEELEFWPTWGGMDEYIKKVAGEVWGSEEKLTEIAGPLVDTMSGYYGGGGGPRYRFEARVSLPGRLIRANGTPDGESVLWFLREEDLSTDEKALEAESVVPDDEKLRSLGARRDLEPWRVLQLTDILTVRDPEGGLKKLLAQAVERSRLALLRDTNIVPDVLRPLARELADLLDPAVTLP